ncbi:MAG: hypothetical protein PUB18_03840, partial [bacterium]|nr:hypothetical protein [bacterium]
HNYLDYDMYCQVSDNKQYCLSRFLNNEVSEGIDVNNRNFITYPEGYSITSRQALAGCNNAYNGKCNDPLAK